uniref:TSA: Wollemia nobilis Ref_Wollemi_Transcript_14656_2307 transcribed RNA sequence n=1 Tax=Wollemia nobilis TaxID=56998 RepID=A0A0C9RSR4_9CONI
MVPANLWFNLILCLVPLLLPPLAVEADPEDTAVYLFCDQGPNYSRGSAFARGLNLVLNSLEDKVSRSGYNITSYEETNVTIYGLAQCRGDLSSADCKTCISTGKQKLLQQCNNISASYILDGCFLRYETYKFYSKLKLDLDTALILYNTQNSTDRKGFNRTVALLLTDVINEAISSSNHFSTKSIPGPSPVTIYSLAQCFRDLTVAECRECLSTVKKYLFKSLPEGALGAQVPNKYCILRYETYQFFNTSVSSPPPPSPGKGFPAPTTGRNSHSKSKLPIILGAIGGGVILFLLLGMLLWKRKAISGLRQKLISPDQAPTENAGVPEGLWDTKLGFKYETLKTATDNFNPVNKLGEGGFGAVYKGVLPDNRNVAVKRLFINARHGMHEFSNEVQLISQVKHKNLVMLLGCSLDGPEHLLVYEYLPNRSLDQFLFDPNKRKTLDWQKRFDMIVAIAGGLAYLHEESEIRIIHRDIKASNILLDENLKPKIADFGLARLFARDESHLSTGVTGTLGYMAPEYLMHGQLTEKADIFSFGVLLLEIVSGKKNNSVFSEEDMLPLLDATWKHYEAGTISETIDPCLKQSILHIEEMCRVAHIALLCTQGSAQMRPTMSEIVVMLTGKDNTLPLPTQPAFIDLNNAEHVKAESEVADRTSMNDVTSNVVEAR